MSSKERENPQAGVTTVKELMRAVISMCSNPETTGEIAREVLGNLTDEELSEIADKAGTDAETLKAFLIKLGQIR